MKQKLNCILLIDDDDATNFINRLIIQRAGITDHIETALNGKEALDFLLNPEKTENYNASIGGPKLILLDINMPVMDGWEFVENYKNLSKSIRDKFLIVMLTTSFNPDDKSRAESIQEIRDFRNKPLSPNMILEILQLHFAA